MLHGVEVFCEFPDGYTLQQIRDHVDQWARRYQRRLTDQQRDITEVFPDADDHPESARYLYGIWRFDYGQGRTNIVADIQRQLRCAVAWYVIRAHECDHDEAAAAGCTDIEVIESGTIPGWVDRPGTQPGDSPPWDPSPPPTEDADEEITPVPAPPDDGTNGGNGGGDSSPPSETNG
jgi:hypothetical protein